MHMRINNYIMSLVLSTKREISEISSGELMRLQSIVMKLYRY